VKKNGTQNHGLGLGQVGFHPIQNIPKRDFLDGALVGVGSLKPHHLSFHMAQVGPLQMPSTKH